MNTPITKTRKVNPLPLLAREETKSVLIAFPVSQYNDIVGTGLQRGDFTPWVLEACREKIERESTPPNKT